MVPYGREDVLEVRERQRRRAGRRVGAGRLLLEPAERRAERRAALALGRACGRRDRRSLPPQAVPGRAKIQIGATEPVGGLTRLRIGVPMIFYSLSDF